MVARSGARGGGSRPSAFILWCKDDVSSGETKVAGFALGALGLVRPGSSTGTLALSLGTSLPLAVGWA